MRAIGSGVKWILMTAYGKGLVPFAVTEAISRRLRAYGWFRQG